MAARDAVSIKDVLNHEVLELQKEARVYALTHFAEDMKEDFKDLLEILEDIEPQEKEFYEFVHSFWYILFGELEDMDSVMDEFIHYKPPSVIRPRTKNILKSWEDSKVTLEN